MLGGGMRQAGIIAASGQYALTHHVDRLAQDHQKASQLGSGIAQLERISLAEPVETNMAMLNISKIDFKALQHFLLEKNIRISSPRLVTHLDISERDIEQVIAAFRLFDEAG